MHQKPYLKYTSKKTEWHKRRLFTGPAFGTAFLEPNVFLS